MRNLFPRVQTLGVALATLALSVLANPGKAQLPIPVPGQRAFARPIGRFNFRDLAAWEKSHPNVFRQPYAVPAPLSIEGRLTVLDTPQIKFEGGSEEDDAQEDALRDPYTPSPIASFLGIVDNGSTIPPDTQGAVGPNHIMTILNSQVQMQDKSGVIKSGPVSLATFCSGGLTSGLSGYDPHVTYDAASGHWVAIIDALNFSNYSNSRILIFISSTSDPTGNWFYYSIPTDSTGATWSDYPTLGISNNWITVGVNKFAVNSGKTGNFVKATVFAFNRVEAEAGANLSYYAWDDTNAFTINPVVTYDPGINTQYMVESDGGNARIRISTITGPTSAPVYTPGAAYATTSTKWSGGGVIGPQSGNTNKVDTGDSRIINSVYRNGFIWCSHTVALPATGPTRTAVQWWEISPTGSVNQHGLLDDSTGTIFRAYPSIAVNSNSDLMIGYARFSATTYPSAYYVVQKSSDPANTLEAEVEMKAGEAPYYKIYGGTRNRWGDYSATVVDPADNLSFWSVQEYAKSPSSTWSTWWAHIPAPAVVTKSVTLNPSTILGGHTGLGIVTMSGPTTASTRVGLSSSAQSVLSFPISFITVPKGATTAPFQYKTYSVTSNTTVTVYAEVSQSQVIVTTTATVEPLALSSFLVSPPSIEGGAPTSLYLYLTGAARTGGYSVSLTSSNPGLVSVPSTLVIPAGASALAIPLDTNLVASNTMVTFTATAGATSLTTTLTLVP